MMPTSMLPRAAEPSPPAVDDSKADALQAMFPDMERAILTDLLAFHGGDVDRVVDMMLDVGGDDADAALARSLQDEQDEQVAKALHNSLQDELKAEDAARRQQEPAAVAARTVSAASVRARKFLMQRVARGRQQTSTHEARLLEPLDISEGEGGGAVAYDMRPLAVSEYAPPALLTTVEGAPSPPAADVVVDSSARYNSRLDRARSANRVRAQSRLPMSTPESQRGGGDSSSVVPLQAPVPEGQLI